MTDFTPNRVTSGKSGAGRFDFKRNSEAEIDLVDDASESQSAAPSKGEIIKAQMNTLVAAQPDDVLSESLDTLRAKKNKTEADYSALSALNLEHTKRAIDHAKTLSNKELVTSAAVFSNDDEYDKLKPSEAHACSAAYDELVTRGVINDGDTVVAPLPPKPPVSDDPSSKLTAMITSMEDKDLVFALGELGAKDDLWDAEHRIFENLNEEHQNRCRVAAKGTPTSALEAVVARSASNADYMSLSVVEQNAYNGACEELAEREIEKKRALRV